MNPSRDENPKKTGRPKKYETPEAVKAAKAKAQKEYRERNELMVTAAKGLIAALEGAADRGRSSKIVDNLPEDPTASFNELAQRLRGKAIVIFNRAATEDF